MAAARSAAVVLLKKLADDSAILETTSCDDDEFLFLLMISSKERKNRIRINSYFERVGPLYSLSDFRSHIRMSRTAITFLEGLVLAACPDLPYEQKKIGTVRAETGLNYDIFYVFLPRMSNIPSGKCTIHSKNRCAP